MSFEQEYEVIIERIERGGFGISCTSLATSLFILLLIIFHKVLRSLTYNFLILIFISEIIRNIGNILIYEKISSIPNFLIPFSDSLTMILFCFFAYSSKKAIKDSNLNIKNRQKLFFILSITLAIIYGTIFLFLYINNENNDKYDITKFYDNESINYIFLFHLLIMLILIIYMIIITCIVVNFMKQKQKNDKVNWLKIGQLIKTLRRFPIICLFYVFFCIPSIFIIHSWKYSKFALIIRTLSFCFMNARGFFIFLNTIKTNKIYIILEYYYEVKFKQQLLLLFDKKDSNSNRSGNIQTKLKS